MYWSDDDQKRFDRAYASVRKAVERLDGWGTDISATAEIMSDPRCRAAVKTLTEKAIREIVRDAWRSKPRVVLVDGIVRKS